MSASRISVGLAQIAPIWLQRDATIAKVTNWIEIAARHSLDVAGHYARPDVTRLVVNRKRQTTTEFID